MTKSTYNPCASTVIKLAQQGKEAGEVVLKDVKTSTAVAVASGIAAGCKTGNIPLMLSGAAVGYGVAAVGANMCRGIGKRIDVFFKNRWKDIKDLNNQTTRTVVTGLVLNGVVKSVKPVAESVCGSSFQTPFLGIMVAAVTTDMWRPTVLKAIGKATRPLANMAKNAPVKVKLWTGLAATAATWFWMSKGNTAAVGSFVTNNCGPIASKALEEAYNRTPIKSLLNLTNVSSLPSIPVMGSSLR